MSSKTTVNVLDDVEQPCFTPFSCLAEDVSRYLSGAGYSTNYLPFQINIRLTYILIKHILNDGLNKYSQFHYYEIQCEIEDV